MSELRFAAPEGYEVPAVLVQTNRITHCKFKLSDESPLVM